MGLLINGKWHDQGYDTKKSHGEFIREQSHFRNWITPQGDRGPTGRDGFIAESGRYHLYVSYACPWAHRTLIMRALKDLENHISISVVHPHMLEWGWQFSTSDPQLSDSLYQRRYLYEIYLLANKTFTGRVTVPVLWDKKQKTVVNNESAEIIRMLNSAFNGIAGNSIDFYPAALAKDIDRINQFVYENINNGVYKCGFAATQKAYDEAFDTLFNALEELENRLKGEAYLVGNVMTESDIRLFTTLIRFDVVYYSHFKCNKKIIKDYVNIFRYLKNIYHINAIKNTVFFDQIKQHYYYSHKNINPTQIVPKGPLIDL
jgi:putative glutathione S-transferase